MLRNMSQHVPEEGVPDTNFSSTDDINGSGYGPGDDHDELVSFLKEINLVYKQSDFDALHCTLAEIVSFAEHELQYVFPMKTIRTKKINYFKLYYYMSTIINSTGNLQKKIYICHLLRNGDSSKGLPL